MYESTQSVHPRQSAVKRIFFITGEPGVGKSTFLTALIKKFALRPSGFITKKHSIETQSFLYIHPVLDGVFNIRYSAQNCAGVCKIPKPIGFPDIFDTYGVETLNNALSFALHGKNTVQQIILMDELGTMENGAESFCREVYRAFYSCSIIGAVKPQKTVFLPVLEKIPYASIFCLTAANRRTLYMKLETTDTFEEFFYAVR